MKVRIRKGDRVRVMRGAEEDKDKVGEVIRVFPKTNRVVVQGVNLVKKHQKQQQQNGRTIPSGILEFEAPVHISNVMLVDAEGEKKAKERSGKRAAVRKAESEKQSSPSKASKTAEKPAEAEKPAAKPAAKKASTAKPASKKAAETKAAAEKKTEKTTTAKKQASTAKPAAKPAVKKNNPAKPVAKKASVKPAKSEASAAKEESK